MRSHSVGAGYVYLPVLIMVARDWRWLVRVYYSGTVMVRFAIFSCYSSPFRWLRFPLAKAFGNRAQRLKATRLLIEASLVGIKLTG